MHQPRHKRTPPSPSLRSATAWSYSLTVGKMVITTGLSLVLAAMLGPRAFGVIAMALVFTNFIEMLQQQGMMPAIIARKNLRDDHADTAFWMVVGVGVVCTAMGLIAAPWWAGLNDLPELTPVIQILALGVPLTSSVVVHEAILRRNMQFKKLAIRTWVSVLAGGAAGIVGALAGWGVWALVAQQVVMNVVVVLVLWSVSSWRPRMRFSPAAARELWSYASRSASSSLGLFLGGRVDIILSGALFGPVIVGLYRMGHRLTTMVVDVTARSMQSVSLPSLAKLQDNPSAFADRLIGMLRFTSYLALPALGLLAGVAPAVEHILGPEWAGTTTAIRLLAISQAFSAVTLLLGPALQARGRPGTLAIILWLWSALTAVAIVLAATVDIDGIGQLATLSLAIVVATAGSATALVVTTARSFRLPVSRMLRAVAPGVAAGLSAALVSAVVTAWDGPSRLLAGGLGGVLGLVAAVGALAGLDPRFRHGIRRPSRLADAMRAMDSATPGGRVEALSEQVPDLAATGELPMVVDSHPRAARGTIVAETTTGPQVTDLSLAEYSASVGQDNETITSQIFNQTDDRGAPSCNSRIAPSTAVEASGHGTGPSSSLR